MSGIAGIAAPNEEVHVEKMLDKLAHRGRTGRTVISNEAGTIGAVWGAAQLQSASREADELAVSDALADARWAQARITGGQLVLERDPHGAAPLYLGRKADGCVCFASEVKALLDVVSPIHEFPPGGRYDGRGLQPPAETAGQAPLREAAPEVAAELHRRLEASVTSGLPAGREEMGAWLSGGLDSSVVSALARPHVRVLHTFAAGLPGAPDLEFARLAAQHLKATHHEVVVEPSALVAALPRVIYYLESFDALLVRSSITNYLAAQRAADFVPAVLSGEGGDELFAGYDYLGSIPLDQLAAELLDISARLHNTALQRVDRSATAHGLVAHVPFLDPAVVDYARRIPAQYKIHSGVEKWILRQAVEGLLPEQVLQRKKAKFWEGAGVGEQLLELAEANVTDADFRSERKLPNGWIIHTKEELMYYRIFREHFGVMADLDWMGRTKGAPSVPYDEAPGSR